VARVPNSRNRAELPAEEESPREIALQAHAVTGLGAPRAGPPGNGGGPASGLLRGFGSGSRGGLLGRAIVVVENAEGGRLEVVELTVLGGPEEGSDGPSGEKERHRDEDVEDGHLAPPNVRERYEVTITLIELTGMRTAARSGPTNPVAASVPTVRL